MKIRKEDKVKILAGKDKGKTGKVLQVLPELNKAAVEGVNLLVKYVRPRKTNEKGQKIQFPNPMDVSKLALICPKCNRAVRVGYTVTEVVTDGVKKHKKNRLCRRCKEII